MRLIKPSAALAALAVLASCVRLIPAPETVPTAPTPTPAPVAANAALLGVARAAPLSAATLAPADASAALASFVESCPVLLRREDASGLTRPQDWEAPCANASGWPAADAANFFASQFEPVRVGDGAAFVTGYFEPEIAGSRRRRSASDVPVYGLPPDLVRGWPANVPEAERTGRAPLGRFDESGAFVPYYDRTEIEEGALDGRAPVIAYASDNIEFFFLQIQGSGRLRTPEGEVIRIGYAGQNGRGYTGIGSVMRQRGLLGDGPGQYPGSMQGIMQYLREHPEDGRELMRLNQSWVFFRELTGDGPIGSIGVPVRRESSVAVDPAFVPYGAPVLLALDRREADGLWIAQDTGGAIKGANRFDSFWGAGADARAIAGGMSGRGQAVLLLPLGTLARLGAR